MSTGRSRREVRDDARRTAISRASLLADPVRQRIHDYVVAQLAPVDRDRAAAATGISRSLAAFHLDRLAGAGLVDVDYRRRGGRNGPGAGRPAKFYRRPAGDSVELSVPERRYRLAADVLAAAIERSAGSATAGVEAVARRRGADIAQSIRPGRSGAAAMRRRLVDQLRREGFEPLDSQGTIKLRNCPFDALVDEHRPLVCGMNLALLEGLAGELPGTGLQARRHIEPGYCCVALEPAG